ncbi:MAG: type I-C CRISPR-associated protein Cas7/Csd2 [Phycisphaeraceae bacterium]|nr:type I-C CRISPR-associated protein Cas7/Csd2 [Phycisphaeraceae bacterium]
MSKASSTPSPITCRYDFLYYFDVADGNPNGDPDAGNLPRLDPETNQGLVTDVCLKRKVRNFVALEHGGRPPYEIFVREGAVLNDQIERAYITSDEVRRAVAGKHNAKSGKGKKKGDDADGAETGPALTVAAEDLAQRWLCDNFFDIRAFGAVLSTGTEKDLDTGAAGGGVKAKIKMTAGQVRGPVQFSFARSIDPIVSAEHSVTRCAVTNEADREKERTMGRKFTVPYGLYCAKGYISAPLADPARGGTGFSDTDLELLKRALNMMFEHDRSAARGVMAPRACIAFRHDHPMGNARADQLFDRVTVELKPEIRSKGRPPRSFANYALTIRDERKMPAGVSVERWIDWA